MKYAFRSLAALLLLFVLSQLAIGPVYGLYYRKQIDPKVAQYLIATILRPTAHLCEKNQSFKNLVTNYVLSWCPNFVEERGRNPLDVL